MSHIDIEHYHLWIIFGFSVTEERDRERAELASVREELRQCRDAAARVCHIILNLLVDCVRSNLSHRSSLKSSR